MFSKSTANQTFYSKSSSILISGLRSFSGLPKNAKYFHH